MLQGTSKRTRPPPVHPWRATFRSAAAPRAPAEGPPAAAAATDHQRRGTTMLARRTLGTQGLAVSALGLGCMSMSHAYGAPEERDERESIATIHRALDLGVTFFDTAEMYGPFTNEELVGRALAGRRDDVVIATKFGFRIENGAMAGVDSRPSHVRAAVAGSLRRLRTD